MKKFLYLLLVLPLLGFFTACDDDKDVPNVTLSMDYEGATEDADGALTVSQGTDLKIVSLKAIPAEGTKEATITGVIYFWDGLPVLRTPIAPFALTIPTADLEEGEHVLGIQANVLQVDKSAGFAITTVKVIITPAEPGQDPDEGGSGTVTPDTRISDHGQE